MKAAISGNGEDGPLAAALTKDVKGTTMAETTNSITITPRATAEDFAALKALNDKIQASHDAHADITNRLHNIRMLRRMAAEIEQATHYNKELAGELENAEEGGFYPGLHGALAALERKLLNDVPRSAGQAQAVALTILEGVRADSKDDVSKGLSASIGKEQIDALMRAVEIMAARTA
ncbi:MAG: hypothetical protein ACRCUE_00180 [Bosea sp. (in: a-proteobacteria)]